jgi:hypothetical protein
MSCSKENLRLTGHALRRIVDYLQDEMVGHTLRANGSNEKFMVQRVSLGAGDVLIFEGISLNKKKPFKASYTIDDQGELHLLQSEH